MPNSTPETRVTGVTGNIVRVESEAPIMKNSVAFVHVGNAQLKGEVLRVQDRRADLQIFEETQGVRVGAQVTLTKELLSATLGPGLLGMVYDGLQSSRPSPNEMGFSSCAASQYPRWIWRRNGPLYPAASRVSACAPVTPSARCRNAASSTK